MFTTNTRARGWCDCDIAMEFARVKKKKAAKRSILQKKNDDLCQGQKT